LEAARLVPELPSNSQAPTDSRQTQAPTAASSPPAMQEYGSAPPTATTVGPDVQLSAAPASAPPEAGGQ
jgi:hypothetical protein